MMADKIKKIILILISLFFLLHALELINLLNPSFVAKLIGAQESSFSPDNNFVNNLLGNSMRNLQILGILFLVIIGCYAIYALVFKKKNEFLDTTTNKLLFIMYNTIHWFWIVFLNLIFALIFTVIIGKIRGFEFFSVRYNVSLVCVFVSSLCFERAFKLYDNSWLEKIVEKDILKYKNKDL